MDVMAKDIQERWLMVYHEKISIDIIEKLLKMATPKSFKKGDVILSIGEKQERVYWIVEGIARSYYLDVNGNDVTKYFMENLCASESFIIQCESEQCIEVLEDMKTLVADALQIKTFILANQQLTSIYIKQLEASLLYKMARENSFLTKSATERYLDLKKQHPHLEERVAQKDIASYLGITSVSLSRIRRTIREEN